MPAKRMSPLPATLNLVVPDEEAAIRSTPELTLFTMREALLPIPPDIERGAGVLVDAPMLTPELKSEVRLSSPVPFGVMVSD